MDEESQIVLRAFNRGRCEYELCMELKAAMVRAPPKESKDTVTRRPVI
jgi:hypothetical protein